MINNSKILLYSLGCTYYQYKRKTSYFIDTVETPTLNIHTLIRDLFNVSPHILPKNKKYSIDVIGSPHFDLELNFRDGNVLVYSV